MSIDTLWYTRCPVPTAFGLAVQLGWIDAEFAPDGIAVRSLATSTDRDVRGSHFRHTQANSFRQGGNIPALIARSRGADVRLIGLASPRISHPVLVPEASPVRSVADLAGRRLALPRRMRDTVDFWRATVIRGYESALATAGLGLDDVRLVEIAVDRGLVDAATDDTGARASLWGAASQIGFQREEAAALVRDEVDAVFSEAGFSAFLRASLGLRTVIDVETLDDPALRVNNGLPQSFTVSGALLDEHPELVARVLARSLEAAAWAPEHRDDARRIVAGEAGLPEELVDEAFTPAFADHLAVHLEPAAIDAIRSQSAFLHEHGFIDEPVDIDAFVAPEPLEIARGAAPAVA